MKTIDLSKGRHSLSEVLTLAKDEPVLIHSAAGKNFLLEPADDFDLEAAALGRNEAFCSFLDARSKESKDTPLQELRKKRGM